MFSDQTILTNLTSSKEHTTFMATLKAANLDQTLKGLGSFTVFAPSNSAFSKLPAGTIEKFLKPVNKAQLIGLMTYHIVSGKYTMADLKDGQDLMTVEGENITISIKNGKMMVNGVNVATPDVLSSNGVIFVTDGVLLPTGDTMSSN